MATRKLKAYLRLEPYSWSPLHFLIPATSLVMSLVVDLTYNY